MYTCTDMCTYKTHTHIPPHHTTPHHTTPQKTRGGVASFLSAVSAEAESSPQNTLARRQTERNAPGSPRGPALLGQRTILTVKASQRSIPIAPPVHRHRHRRTPTSAGCGREGKLVSCLSVNGERPQHWATQPLCAT